MILKSKTCKNLFILFVDASILHVCVFKRTTMLAFGPQTAAGYVCPQVKTTPIWRTSHDKQSLLMGFFSSRKIYKERLSESILSTFKGKGPCTPPCEFIIILRLSQAQWIWNANELVRIKKSLWSETSPNLLQDERYIAMAYAPSLSAPEPPR